MSIFIRVEDRFKNSYYVDLFFKKDENGKAFISGDEVSKAFLTNPKIKEKVGNERNLIILQKYGHWRIISKSDRFCVKEIAGIAVPFLFVVKNIDWEKRSNVILFRNVYRKSLGLGM